MNWNRVGTNGMQSGEYRVGKFAADEGAQSTAPKSRAGIKGHCCELSAN